MWQIEGWLSAEAARASRWNRSRVCGDAVIPPGKTFIATSRSRRVSLARYTSPIPPAPSGLTISYGPRRVPGGWDNCLLRLPRKRERHVLARVIPAADGDDDVLLAVDRVGHRRSALRRRHPHRADLLPLRLFVRAQHRAARM